MVPKYLRFRVTGIFNSGFLRLRQFLGIHTPFRCTTSVREDDVVAVLEFKDRRHLKAGEVARNAGAGAGPGFMATNWMEQNKANLPCSASGACSDVHHHWSYSLRRRD